MGHANYKLRWNGECYISGSKVTVSRGSGSPYRPVPEIMEFWPHVYSEGRDGGTDGEALLLHQSKHLYCVVDALGERYYEIHDNIAWAVLGVASGGHAGTWYAMSDKWVYDFGNHKRVKRVPSKEPEDAEFPDFVNAYLECIGNNTQALSADATMKCDDLELEVEDFEPTRIVSHVDDGSRNDDYRSVPPEQVDKGNNNISLSKQRRETLSKGSPTVLSMEQAKQYICTWINEEAEITADGSVVQVRFQGLETPLTFQVIGDRVHVIDHVISTCMEIFDSGDYFVLHVLCSEGIMNIPADILKAAVVHIIKQENMSGVGSWAKSNVRQEEMRQQEIEAVNIMPPDQLCSWIKEKKSRFLKQRLSSFNKPTDPSGWRDSFIKRTVGNTYNSIDKQVQSLKYEVQSLFLNDAVRLAVFENALLYEAVMDMRASPKGNWYVKSHKDKGESNRTKRLFFEKDLLEQLLEKSEDARQSTADIGEQLKNLNVSALRPDSETHQNRGILILVVKQIQLQLTKLIAIVEGQLPPVATMLERQLSVASRFL